MYKSFQLGHKHISNIRTTDRAEVHGNEIVLATNQEMRFRKYAMDRYIVGQEGLHNSIATHAEPGPE